MEEVTGGMEGRWASYVKLGAMHLIRARRVYRLRLQNEPSTWKSEHTASPGAAAAAAAPCHAAAPL